MAQIGFMITRSSCASSGSRSFFLLAKAALEKGHAVRVFCCSDGVYQCLRDQVAYAKGEDSVLNGFDELKYAGAEIFASHSCTSLRGIGIDDLHPVVRLSTFEEINRIVGLSDRMICL